MTLLFSGKLVSSAQDPPPFTGCRVEALYEFRAPSVQTAAASGSLTDDLSLAAHHARVSEALERGDLVEAGAVPATTAVAPPPPAAPAPGRASALCDAEGHFVLSLPDRKDITSEKVIGHASDPVPAFLGVRACEDVPALLAIEPPDLRKERNLGAFGQIRAALEVGRR